MAVSFLVSIQQRMTIKPNRRYLVVPDLQIPLHNVAAVKSLIKMAKHEKFDLGKNRQVNVYQITKDELFAYLDLVLQFLTGDSMNNSVYKLSKYTLESVMNSKKNVDLMSIRDDIVRNINRMKYRLRLQ